MTYAKGPRGARARPAAALVEFAMVAPLLFLLVMGSVEFARAFMANNLLANAARCGGRVGAIPGTANADITASVDQSLGGVGISGHSVSVTVNGKPVDAKTAFQGDTVEVSVSVPYSAVTWLPSPSFLADATLKETVVMRRE